MLPLQKDQWSCGQRILLILEYLLRVTLMHSSLLFITYPANDTLGHKGALMYVFAFVLLRFARV